MKYCPTLEVSSGVYIRKTTVLWLLQEGERVSSDRLFRVRATQPYDTSTSQLQPSTHDMNLRLPKISDEAEVGDMCVFDRENGWMIGCVLQFAFYKEKTITNYQYKGSIANIHDKNLGVMCTWYTRKEHSGTFEMQSNDIHEYLSVSKYVCTLTFECFLDYVTRSTILEPKKSMCREFILTKESEQFICQHANTVDIQVPQPVIVIDESTRCNSENIVSPKWLEVHGIKLYQTERDALMGNDWLNDLHIHVAQSMIKNQFPHISG